MFFPDDSKWHPPLVAWKPVAGSNKADFSGFRKKLVNNEENKKAAAPQVWLGLL